MNQESDFFMLAHCVNYMQRPFLVWKVLSKTRCTHVSREDWIVVIHEPQAQWRIPGRIKIQYNTILGLSRQEGTDVTAIFWGAFAGGRGLAVPAAIFLPPEAIMAFSFLACLGKLAFVKLFILTFYR